MVRERSILVLSTHGSDLSGFYDRLKTLAARLSASIYHVKLPPNAGDHFDVLHDHMLKHDLIVVNQDAELKETLYHLCTDLSDERVATILPNPEHLADYPLFRFLQNEMQRRQVSESGKRKMDIERAFERRKRSKEM